MRRTTFHITKADLLHSSLRYEHLPRSSPVTSIVHRSIMPRGGGYSRSPDHHTSIERTIHISHHTRLRTNPQVLSATSSRQTLGPTTSCYFLQELDADTDAMSSEPPMDALIHRRANQRPDVTARTCCCFHLDKPRSPLLSYTDTTYSVLSTSAHA